MVDKLKEKFKNEIVEIKFVKKQNNDYLQIKTNLKVLSSIVDITKKIKIFLEQNDKDYLLEVISNGTEEFINIDNLDKNLGKNVVVLLKNSTKYEGIINEVSKSSIIVRYNCKGQFRNKEIILNEILKINKSAIIKKNKGGKK